MGIQSRKETMNCKFEIAVSQIAEKMDEFIRADDGLAALTGLLDTGAIRVSAKNEACVRALRSALNDRWTLIEQYQKPAPTKVRCAWCDGEFPEDALNWSSGDPACESCHDTVSTKRA